MSNVTPIHKDISLPPTNEYKEGDLVGVAFSDGRRLIGLVESFFPSNAHNQAGSLVVWSIQHSGDWGGVNPDYENQNIPIIPEPLANGYYYTDQTLLQTTTETIDLTADSVLDDDYPEIKTFLKGEWAENYSDSWSRFINLYERIEDENENTESLHNSWLTMEQLQASIQKGDLELFLPLFYDEMAGGYRLIQVNQFEEDLLKHKFQHWVLREQCLNRPMLMDNNKFDGGYIYYGIRLQHRNVTGLWYSSKNRQMIWEFLQGS